MRLISRPSAVRWTWVPFEAIRSARYLPDTGSQYGMVVLDAEVGGERRRIRFVPADWTWRRSALRTTVPDSAARLLRRIEAVGAAAG